MKVYNAIIGTMLMVAATAADRIEYLDVATSTSTETWVAGQQGRFVFCWTGMGKYHNPAADKKDVRLVVKHGMTKHKIRKVTYSAFAPQANPTWAASKKQQALAKSGKCYIVEFEVPGDLKTSDKYELYLERKAMKMFNNKYNMVHNVDIISQEDFIQNNGVASLETASTPTSKSDNKLKHLWNKMIGKFNKPKETPTQTPSADSA